MTNHQTFKSAKGLSNSLDNELLAMSSLVVETQKATAIDLLNKLVSGTPVKKGEARGGWYADEGSPPNHAPGRLDTVGGTVLAEEIKKIVAIKVPALIVLSNNVPYIVKLDQGSSDQAPQGIVDVAIEQVREGL